VKPDDGHLMYSDNVEMRVGWRNGADCIGLQKGRFERSATV
jgi:hypothetical protein